MRIKSLYAEIVCKLEKMADNRLAKMDKYYHKTAGHKSYGIRTPELIELIKKYRGIFKQLNLSERLELAKMFFISGYAEQSGFGITALKLSVKEIEPVHFSILDELAGCLNNWGTTDGFSIDVMQPILNSHTKETLSMLKKWNNSENLWKRRASVVVFTRKTGASGKFTNEALSLCDNLVWDKEDMVRKGVGWTLKDCVRGDKNKVLNYIKSLRRKGVSAVITLYAIRDLKGKERKEVLSIRPSSP